MKRALALVMTMFLGAGLALAQTGGDKTALNPQPLPPGRHPVSKTASTTSGKKGGKKGHKGGKKSKKGSSSTTTTPPK